MDLTLPARAMGAMAAAAVGLWFWRSRRPPDYESPFGDLMGAVLAGLAVGRLVYLVGEGVELWSRPLDVVMVRGGITPGAAAVAALGYLLWACRSDRWARMDYLAPAGLLGLAAWEAGCWWQGACLGSPSGLWWGLALPGSEVTRHPVGIYAALLLALGAWGLVRWGVRWRGVATWSALSWAALVRLLVPWWSVETWSSRTWWYALGLLVGLGGTTWAIHRSARRAEDLPASSGLVAKKP